MDERELVAVEMHNLYESWAAEYGWKTQEVCRTDYADLPEKNKRVMEKMADWHLARVRESRAQAFEEVAKAIEAYYEPGNVTSAMRARTLAAQVRALAARKREVKP